MSSARGQLFIISAPSGGGKTSLVRGMLARVSDIKLSISYTTRPIRPGDTDGISYFFVDEEQFKEKIDSGDFLEHANVFGNYYGTCRNWVESELSSGQDVLLEIDWQGGQSIKELYPDAVGVFILPPSKEVLEERLKGRGSDSPEVVAKRLSLASEEMGHAKNYDYIIVNDDFEQSLDSFCSIFAAQRLCRERQFAKHGALIKQLAID